MLLIVAALVGLLVSTYLAIVDLTGGGTLCLAGSDCDVVRASSYGRIVGLPVAVAGVAYFAVALAFALRRAPSSRRAIGILGGGGFGAALVFVLLQGLVLRSWCPYCLVADGAAFAVGLRVFWPRSSSAPAGTLTHGVVGAVLAVAILGAGFLLNPPSAASTTTSASSTVMSADRLAALADHLRAGGAVFYGAYWCPHCQEQKQMFGTAASRLPYVECDPRGAGARPDLCQAAGVRAYPTWVIAGQTIEGEVSPDRLAQLAGFVR